jgi:hypothetical protein
MAREARDFHLEEESRRAAPSLYRNVREVRQYSLNQVRQLQSLFRYVVVDVVPDVLFVARMDALVFLREKDRNGYDGSKEQRPLQRFHNFPRYITDLELRTG